MHLDDLHHAGLNFDRRAPSHFSQKKAFPLPAVGLKGTCDRAASAAPPGARLPPGSLPGRLPWIGSGSEFRSFAAARERVSPNPIGSGLVEGLAHPGGNITGLSLMTLDDAIARCDCDPAPPRKESGLAASIHLAAGQFAARVINTPSLRASEALDGVRMALGLLDFVEPVVVHPELLDRFDKAEVSLRTA
jgi:hypothetical protein